MRKLGMLAVVALAVFGLTPAASADVQVSMQGGHVTIVAKDATVRQILAEWARVGQTRIINGERIPGGPLTLELRDVPEQQALNVLLRSVSGFVVAPRANATAATNLSVFDRIIVLPTSVAPAAAPTSAPPPAFSQPTFVQPLPAIREDDDEPPEPGTPGQPPAGNRGPVFVFPQPQLTNPQQRPPQRPTQQFPQVVQPTLPPVGGVVPAAPTTATPTGVSVPGMVVPAPPQPGQPGSVVVAPQQ